MTETQDCTKCKHLKKYNSEDGRSWMMVCEGDDPEEDSPGRFLVTAIDVGYFDASDCLAFESKVQTNE